MRGLRQFIFRYACVLFILFTICSWGLCAYKVAMALADGIGKNGVSLAYVMALVAAGVALIWSWTDKEEC